ncbi:MULTISPECIES: hypothetical protein [Laceyella]|uniref:Uncharacterized protein n=2 Tax=Laceyella TaxID=292635 RepID=A0ABY5U4B4_LACSH|nr:MULTISPECIES: hypothetical protein [Laceyella]PRZ16334.1 hypothetical protein CLV36_10242 [Laceyella sediminis]UWE03420.1 hypothetical protein NYR52_15145 [Laceyella sacchari]
MVKDKDGIIDYSKYREIDESTNGIIEAINEYVGKTIFSSPVVGPWDVKIKFSVLGEGTFHKTELFLRLFKHLKKSFDDKIKCAIYFNQYSNLERNAREKGDVRLDYVLTVDYATPRFLDRIQSEVRKLKDDRDTLTIIASQTE